jgi:hypothetical protein
MLQIRFDTVNALDAWVHDPAPRIQVKQAKHWSACNASEIEKSNAKMQDFDWCCPNLMRSTATAVSDSYYLIKHLHNKG